MRLKKLVLLAMCVSIAVIPGCKATPKTEAISQKTGLSELVKSKSIKEGTKKIASVINAPEKESFQLVSDSGMTTLNIDATVEIPDVTSIPVVTVEDKNLEELDLEKLSKYFMGDLEYSVSKSVSDMSKGEITKLIEEQKEYMADESKYEGLDDESIKMFEEQDEEYLQELQGYYDEAPEVAEEIPLDYKLRSYENSYQGEDAKRFSIEARDGNVTKYFTTITGEVSDQVSYYTDQEQAYSVQGYSGGSFESDKNICKYTKEEAEAKCQEILKLCGIEEDYVLENSYETIKDSVPDAYVGYTFSYTKKVSGVKATFDPQRIEAVYESITGEDSESTATEGTVPKDYERVQISFDETGLAGFYWNNPEVVSEVKSENVELISYEDAIKIFKEEVFSKSTMVAETIVEDSSLEETGSTSEKVAYDIEKITLGLMRVKDASTGGYVMIPVYDFFMTTGTGMLPSVLTINGLDGSIIDRTLGY